MYKKLLLLVSLFLSSLLLMNAAIAQFNLPPGDYQGTCHGCMVINGRLSCFCQDQHGFPRHTSIMVKRGVDITNDNGQLRYVSRHHYRRPWPRRRRNLQDINAGPIGGQADAESRCPSVCRRAGGKWTGQWHTTVFGQQSVCQCELTRYY